MGGKVHRNNENVVFVKWRKEGEIWRKVLKLRRPPVISGKEHVSRNRSSVK